MSRRRPHHLVLSPHLDDAALSCGGTIHRWSSAGESILVVSVMTGDPPDGELSPYAGSQHARWDLPPREAYALRRAEDRAALEALGAGLAHLPLLDCIYRRGPEGTYYNSDDDIFGTIHPADAGLAHDVLRQVAALEVGGPGDLTVYAPLGLGNHVDHQIVRRAAEAWLGPRLVYYEDYPYAEKADPAAAPAGLTPWLVPLTEGDLAARIAAIGCYRSQIGVLFGSYDEMVARVRGYAGRLAPPGNPGAERFWRPMV
jgi:LmbE family N-acetylglucosaminyl deacetylase